jgi:hypothetical protein
MQVVDIKAGQIVSATIPERPREEPGPMRGIGWTPDEREIWENGNYNDPHVYIWDVLDPTAPKLKERRPLADLRLKR